MTVRGGKEGRCIAEKNAVDARNRRSFQNGAPLKSRLEWRLQLFADVVVVIDPDVVL
jgi:hypothetical protein